MSFSHDSYHNFKQVWLYSCESAEELNMIFFIGFTDEVC